MKRNTYIVLVAVFCILTTMLCVDAAAKESEFVFNYKIEGTEYTVAFKNTELSMQEQEKIAERLLGISTEIQGTYKFDSCSHSFTTTNAEVITHKYRAIYPRCKKDTYDVKTCTKCGYTTETYLYTGYIGCCPVD